MKEVVTYLKVARKAGWRVRQGTKHVVLYPPDGSRPISVSLRNNEKFHGYLNLRALLRSKGLDV